jgi:hypothetical protein
MQADEFAGELPSPVVAQLAKSSAAAQDSNRLAVW